MLKESNERRKFRQISNESLEEIRQQRIDNPTIPK